MDDFFTNKYIMQSLIVLFSLQTVMSKKGWKTTQLALSI